MFALLMTICVCTMNVQEIVHHHWQSEIDKVLDKAVSGFGREWHNIVLGNRIDEREGPKGRCDLFEHDQRVHPTSSACPGSLNHRNPGDPAVSPQQQVTTLLTSRY